MRRLTRNILPILIIILLFISCQKKERVFELISYNHSGVTFSKTIFRSDSVLYVNIPYSYTGAGVGIGDFNDGGYPDVYIDGNMVSSRLY
ncbi:MAG: hypothetical protein ACFB15_22020, partial [Cyclobacteriaceae bacterium]